MSEEDIDTANASTSTPRRGTTNADRRTPRFSWNYAYEATFFRSLCESMQMGYKENHSFKAGAWERAAIALRDKHQAYPEKSHLINKADNARKKFRMWRGLREDPDFLYNPNTRMVTASEEAWRRHFEKEPLSKALRGRPFDHEEYMEILFPDVVGSGGAPKRIMKKRKGPDGVEVPTSTTPVAGHAMNELAALESATFPQASPSQVIPPPTPSAVVQQIPTPVVPPVQPTQPIQRPTSTAIPPRNSLGGPSALTPPDEQVPGQGTPQGRKRYITGDAAAAASQSAEKRRGRPSRFSTNFYGSVPPGSTPNSAVPATTGSSALATVPAVVASDVGLGTAQLFESGLHALSEALTQRQPPRWPEQALEIFFREFADEDADLQLKIAEKALTDDNKAMVFVKMTPVLREHWVGRLREVHQRNLGSGLGLGIGGRAGDEAS